MIECVALVFPRGAFPQSLVTRPHETAWGSTDDVECLVGEASLGRMSDWYRGPWQRVPWIGAQATPSDLRVVELCVWPRKAGVDSERLLDSLENIRIALDDAPLWAVWCEATYDDPVVELGATDTTTLIDYLRRVAARQISGLFAWSRTD